VKALGRGGFVFTGHKLTGAAHNRLGLAAGGLIALSAGAGDANLLNSGFSIGQNGTS
jgi:hypothetical protein